MNVHFEFYNPRRTRDSNEGMSAITRHARKHPVKEIFLTDERNTSAFVQVYYRNGDYATIYGNCALLVDAIHRAHNLYGAIYIRQHWESYTEWRKTGDSTVKCFQDARYRLLSPITKKRHLARKRTRPTRALRARRTILRQWAFDTFVCEMSNSQAKEDGYMIFNGGQRIFGKPAYFTAGTVFRKHPDFPVSAFGNQHTLVLRQV